MVNLSQRVLELVGEARVLRPRDLDTHGIPRTYLSRLAEAGKLTRISRGLYTLAEADVTEHQTLIEASKKLPNGVICLLSALRFHNLTTASPYEVWMAIGEKDWNKVGLDLALEALRECWRENRATADELWHFADLCRVKNVMRPYLETIIQ